MTDGGIATESGMPFNPDRPYLGLLGQDGGKVGNAGAFVKKAKSTCFANSSILSTTGSFIESGRFQEGVVAIKHMLEDRRITFIYGGRLLTRGTLVKDGVETMVLEPDFPTSHPIRQLWALVHRNMSLILQRDGKRENSVFMRQLLEIDIAYAEAVRFGAKTLGNEKQRKEAIRQADEIEFNTRRKFKDLR